ncbi:hypothetical protein C8A01DRAFT_18470, partial [Parachaetomium inaequale]
FATTGCSVSASAASNGSPVPNLARVFKLNWASGSGGGLVDRRDDRGPEFSIFVCWWDLGPEVNEFMLVSLFLSRFPSCKSAKIMTDAMTGQSRGRVRSLQRRIRPAAWPVMAPWTRRPTRPRMSWTSTRSWSSWT